MLATKKKQRSMEITPGKGGTFEQNWQIMINKISVEQKENEWKIHKCEV